MDFAADRVSILNNLSILPGTRVALRRGIEPRTAYEDKSNLASYPLRSTTEGWIRSPSEALIVFWGLVCEMQEGGESNPSTLIIMDEMIVRTSFPPEVARPPTLLSPG